MPIYISNIYFQPRKEHIIQSVSYALGILERVGNTDVEYETNKKLF